MWLSPEQVRRTAEAPLPLQALLDDGARVASREPYPTGWTVRPFGTAEALCLLWQASQAGAWGS